ncbi:MAG: amidohydrolase family protein [Planctomycetes bacterium]|nr:amidohydrolase family protein [Planctomycetota bacterium]
MKPFLVFVAAALAALLPTSPAQDLVAIRAGKVWTISSGLLENAVILVKDGRIEAVGADLEVPWNATVVDARDKVVMPAWILAHSTAGLGGGNNERMQNVPFLTVADGLDPSSLAIEEGRRNGVGVANVMPGNQTLVAGRGLIARYVGRTVEEMTLRERSGLKLSFAAGQGNVIAQIREMRRVLDDAAALKKDLERKREEWQKAKDAGAIKDEEFKEEPDETKKPLVDLIEGKLVGWLYVPGSAELAEVARLKEKYALKLVLILGPRCYKAAEQVKALGYPVVLDENALEFRETDPETGDEKIVSPAKVFADAGIEFAISLGDDGRGPERHPWWQLATMVRSGIDRETALRSLTSVPAKILGLDAELGTIQAGRAANLQVLTGDPFQATSWVDTVMIDGEIVYERSKDQRLKLLFGENEGNK